MYNLQQDFLLILLILQILLTLAHKSETIYLHYNQRFKNLDGKNTNSLKGGELDHKSIKILIKCIGIKMKCMDNYISFYIWSETLVSDAQVLSMNISV